MKLTDHPFIQRLRKRLDERRERRLDAEPSPFGVLVEKEIREHVNSWRFLVLLGIITLTCLSSLYSAISTMVQNADRLRGEEILFFLQLFTLSNGTLPSYVTFVSFLGPLLGIGIGFERNPGILPVLRP